MAGMSWEFKSPHPHYLECTNDLRFSLMILLKISNSSELVALKFGAFVEKLTPDAIDDSVVEEFVVKRMMEDLSLEGVKGEITVVDGIEVADNKLMLGDDLKVRNRKVF